MSSPGLHLERRDLYSRPWWNIIHTASNQPVSTATSHFARKRDAQKAMDALLATGVDWTLTSMRAIRTKDPSAATKVDRLLYQISQERRS